MLKEMRNTLDQENGGLFAGEGSDTYGGMFDMYMSQHLAKSQPLGIGNAVGRALQGYTQVNNS
jgi:flagellar protein FlgJ